MINITCALSSSGDEERMMKYWINIHDLQEDITSKKGKGPKFFEDRT